MTEGKVTNIGENGRADASEFLAFQHNRIQALETEIERRDEADKKEPLTLEAALGNLKPDEDYTPVYEIRKVTTKDFKRIVGMIRKIRNNEGLQAALASGDGTQAMNAGFSLLLEELEEEFIPFLADLAQKTPEEFDEEPFGAVFDILNDLKAEPNFLSALRSATYFVMTGKRLFGR